MDLAAHLRTHFEEGIELRRRMAETLPGEIARAGEALAAALKSGKKALACGNGGSAADSQHFAAELVGRFERERPGLPAVSLTTDTSALTAIANDYDFDRVFSKQVEALGAEGDILLAISTSGSSKNVVEAMKAAQARKLVVIPWAACAARVTSTSTWRISARCACRKCTCSSSTVCARSWTT